MAEGDTMLCADQQYHLEAELLRGCTASGRCTAESPSLRLCLGCSVSICSAALDERIVQLFVVVWAKCTQRRATTQQYVSKKSPHKPLGNKPQGATEPAAFECMKPTIADEKCRRALTTQARLD